MQLISRNFLSNLIIFSLLFWEKQKQHIEMYLNRVWENTKIERLVLKQLSFKKIM